MERSVEVKDKAAAVMDHEQAVEETARRCRHDEEIDCGDELAVVVE